MAGPARTGHPLVYRGTYATSALYLIRTWHTVSTSCPRQGCSHEENSQPSNPKLVLHWPLDGSTAGKGSSARCFTPLHSKQARQLAGAEYGVKAPPRAVLPNRSTQAVARREWLGHAGRIRTGRWRAWVLHIAVPLPPRSLLACIVCTCRSPSVVPPAEHHHKSNQNHISLHIIS